MLTLERLKSLSCGRCLKILMWTEFKTLYIAILWPATGESSARSPSPCRRKQGAHVCFKISEDSLELHEWEWSAGRDEEGVEWVRVLASWSVAFSPGSFQPSAGSAEIWSECHLSAYSPAVQPSLTALPGFPGSSCPPAHAQTHVKIQPHSRKKVTSVGLHTTVLCNTCA